MKKTLSFVFAAIAVLTVASCAREMFEPVENNCTGEKATFTISFGEDGSKTARVAGKTVWAEGDSILLSDGSKTLKIGIPSSAAGQKDAAISIPIDSTINVYGDLYAVYPASAYKSVSSGNVVVAVPNDQSGNFDEANICVAKCTCPDNNFALKNATAMLKIKVADDVETVMISAAATDTLAGTLACTYKKDTALVVKSTSAVKSVKLAIGGVGGDYYVAVVPGNYTEFSVMALSLAGKSQRKTTTNKSLKLCDLADLGTIGDAMSGSTMEGSGSESDPFLIKDLADLTTLATFVNNGLSYADNYFKLVNDITDITIPVGTFDQVDLPFQGHFDGQNHTVTLAMGTADSAGEDSYLGFFGDLGEGAEVKDLTIAGTIATTGSHVGGLAGNADGQDAGVTVTNVTNTATIVGGEWTAGLLGYTVSNNDKNFNVTDCHNKGAVTTNNTTAGGIAGTAIHTNFVNCDNTGAITAKTACETIYTLPAGAYRYSDINGQNTSNLSGVTRGTGGILGVVYNSSVKTCVNNGPVSTVSKAGGIGGTIYWGSITECTNNATVTASGNIAGGIVGLQFVAGTVSKNTNAAAVTANAAVGGIIGVSGAQERSSNAYLTISGNTNNGAVESTGVTSISEYNYGFASLSAAGGIVGLHQAYNRDWLNILGCTNNGKVHGVGQAVGGVLGFMGNPRNGADWGYIDGCVNNGEVSADIYRVGGIAGIIFDRFTTCHMAIRNCANTGKITSKNCVGGILGWARPAYPTSNSTTKMTLSNCVNTGDVAYTDTTAKVWTGTIAGYFTQVDVENCWNGGAIIAPTENNNATGEALGVLVGLSDAYAIAKYLYADYDEEISKAIEKAEGVTAGILYGSLKGATTTVSDLYMVDSEGALSPSVTVNSTECSTPVDALNAWVGTSTTYKKWKLGSNGPEFVTE